MGLFTKLLNSILDDMKKDQLKNDPELKRLKKKLAKKVKELDALKNKLDTTIEKEN